MIADLTNSLRNRYEDYKRAISLNKVSVVCEINMSIKHRKIVKC